MKFPTQSKPTIDPDAADLATVAEAAALMRVSKMTVYRLVHSGQIPAIKIRQSFRIHRDHLAEYLHSA